MLVNFSQNQVLKISQTFTRLLEDTDEPDAGTSGTISENLVPWGICTRKAGKLDKGRYQLYRSQLLQENMSWKALAEIYTMHSLHRSLISKFSLKIAESFAVFSQKFANFARILLNFAKS